MLNKADYTGMYKYLFVSGLLYILYNYLLQRDSWYLITVQLVNTEPPWDYQVFCLYRLN